MNKIQGRSFTNLKLWRFFFGCGLTENYLWNDETDGSVISTYRMDCI